MNKIKPDVIREKLNEHEKRLDVMAEESDALAARVAALEAQVAELKGQLAMTNQIAMSALQRDEFLAILEQFRQFAVETRGYTTEDIRAIRSFVAVTKKYFGGQP